ncbi:hypothetical protein P885DRAFT_60823 [Corynascus similis CBS 632.67]
MAADNGHLPGILRLTSEIRHRIYQAAGLGRQYWWDDYTSPTIYHLGATSASEAVKSDISYGDGPATFRGLLLSCRTIYNEASALLYSENWFWVRYRSPRSLAALRALTPHAVASLTNLRVVLNETSCHYDMPYESRGHCCNRGWGYKGTEADSSAPELLYGCNDCLDNIHDLPLNASSALDDGVISEWRTTAAYLASHIVPGRLELSLICDVDHGDVETAKLVLDSLGMLPRLKDCHLRLCETRDSRLQRLASEAVLKARGFAPAEPQAPSRCSNSRLLSLPLEVRLRILEHTDLITPSREVTWNRAVSDRGYYIVQASNDGRCGHEFCAPQCRGECRLFRCWQEKWPEPSLGCFCRRRHTAFSTRCRCWTPPTPLFLVCRKLYEEANLIFYSRNRFIIIDSPCSSPFASRESGEYPFASFAASQFLKQVAPRQSLGYIRFLELVFSPFNHQNLLKDGHPALQDWKETVQWVKDKLNIPALTLRLVVAGHPNPYVGTPSGGFEMTRAEGKEVLATYSRILYPLQLLSPDTGKGLARFYAKLPWPMKWSHWIHHRLGEEEEAVQELIDSKEQELKERAELFVMGQRYERVSAAAAEPEMSVWWWGRPDEYSGY